MRHFFRVASIAGSLLLLAGCLGHRVSVFDAQRSYVGIVRIRNDDLAIIYGLERSRIGEVEEGTVTAPSGETVATVDDRGLIRNPIGQLIGRFSNGKLCLSLYNDVLGFFEEDVAIKPGAAACMLLFLLKKDEVAPVQ